MIKTQELVPGVYYNQSRDFQLLGRTFDVVFNYLKTNIDLIYNNPLSENSDERLIDLLSLTLGFKSKHNYNVKQLTAMCSAFMLAMRNKGNIQSIQLAVDTILQAEGIKNGALTLVDTSKSTLHIYVPMELSDINLLNDLLVYILPAGMSCSIVRQQLITKEALTETSADSQIVYLHTKTTDKLSGVSGYTKDNLKASNTNSQTIDNMIITPYKTESNDTDYLGGK